MSKFMSKFMAGDIVKHTTGNHYQIITTGLLEASLEPVYVYKGNYQTWIRPHSEMEDGRFELVFRPDNLAWIREA